MKKTKIFSALAAALCAVMLPLAALAADSGTAVEVTTLEQLKSELKGSGTKTIKLMNNFTYEHPMATSSTAEWNITLDLNGHTLYKTGVGRALQLQSVYGHTFTITDTSKEQTGAIICEQSNAVWIAFKANLILNAGILQSKSSSAAEISSGSMVMNGGKLICGEGQTGISFFNSGNVLTINGGDVGSYADPGSSGTVTVCGGIFNTKPAAIKDGCTVIPSADGRYEVVAKADNTTETKELNAEKVSEVMAKYGIEQEVGMTTRFDEIKLSAAGGKKGVGIVYGYDDKSFTQKFDFKGEISGGGDVAIGVFLYNIPDESKLSAPTVYTY